jgi:hypothetical protein
MIVVSGQVPGGSGILGADVRILTMADPRLALTPVGLILSGPGLLPGTEDHAARGAIQAQNVSGIPLTVRLTAKVTDGPLSELLMVRIRAGDDTVLFSGPAAELTDGPSNPFTIEPGQVSVVTFTTWLPRSVTQGFEGEQTDIALEWISSP